MEYSLHVDCRPIIHMKLRTVLQAIIKYCVDINIIINIVGDYKAILENSTT